MSPAAGVFALTSRFLLLTVHGPVRVTGDPASSVTRELVAHPGRQPPAGFGELHQLRVCQASSVSESRFKSVHK